MVGNPIRMRRVVEDQRGYAPQAGHPSSLVALDWEEPRGAPPTLQRLCIAGGRGERSATGAYSGGGQLGLLVAALEGPEDHG